MNDTAEHDTGSVGRGGGGVWIPAARPGGKLVPFVLALLALIGPAQAQDPVPGDEDAPPVEDAEDATAEEEREADPCSLEVIREPDPTIDSPLPAGMNACKVALLVDDRGRVADIEATSCPPEALEEARPTLERWRFRRNDCPADELVRFEVAVETDSRTHLLAPAQPATAERFAVAGFDGCVLALTLLPDGRVDSVRSTDPDACTLAAGNAGWNPERFWRHEITGLRCTAYFDSSGGLANGVRFEGCGGPSRMALLSFVERATWGTDLPDGTPFRVHFRLRDDGSEPLDRISEQARLVRRPTCPDLAAPARLANRTRIPAMPARWAMDRSEVAAYCRLRVHLDADATPRRIDALLCGEVFAPRAASAVARWQFDAPTCAGEPVPSEVVVLVPFAERLGSGGLRNPLNNEPILDLAAEVQPLLTSEPTTDCAMEIQIPVRGKVRMATNRRSQCFVTPTGIPSLRAGEIRRWGDVINGSVDIDDFDAGERGDTHIHIIECRSRFTVTTTEVRDVSITGCFGRAPDKVRRAIERWSWSVLGRESQVYDVTWRFRIE